MTNILACQGDGCNSTVEPGQKFCEVCAVIYEASIEQVRSIVRHDFPVDIFPSKIATFVRTYAAATPSPLSWVGAAVLNIATAAIGSRRRVVLKENWTERAVNWTALVGESGSRKTPTVAPLIAPLREIERKLARESAQAKREWAEKKGKDKGVEPGWKQFVFTDITFEALVRAVADNKNFFGEYDELSSFLRGMGQYKQGGGSDRDHWVSLFSTGVINYRRVQQNLRVYEEDVHVSLLGGVQPPKLKMLRDESGDGLEYRFLYAEGEHIPLSEAVGSPLHQDWYNGTITTLAEGMECTLYAPQSCYNLLVAKENNYAAAGVELGVASKALGYVARNAITLHALRCLDTGHEVPMADEDFERAALVQDHFVETWESRIAGKMRESARSSDREVTVHTLMSLRDALWRSIGGTEIGRSKIMQQGYAGCDSARKMNQVVTLIHELGDDSPLQIVREKAPQIFRARKPE